MSVLNPGAPIVNPEWQGEHGTRRNFRSIEMYMRGTIVLSDGRADGFVFLGGRSGGQTIYFGSDSGDDGILHSNPSKDGKIFLGDTSAYDEANDRLGVGTTSPTEEIQAVATDEATIEAKSTGANSKANVVVRNDAIAWRWRVQGNDVLGLNEGGTANVPIQAVSGAASNLLFLTGTRVGIGTAAPLASTAVDITSTTGALLLPRMTTTQRDALTPVNGMVIYNSTTGVIEGYESGAWVNL